MKKRKYLKLCIVLCALCFLAAGVILAWMWYIDVPVKIKYRLSDLSDNQAVMVVLSYLEKGEVPESPPLMDARHYYAIMNKNGAYKYILAEDFNRLAKEAEAYDPDTYDPNPHNWAVISPKHYDRILAMEDIPYQEETIPQNIYYLQRIINIEEVDLSTSLKAVGATRWFYYGIYGSKKRKKVQYFSAESFCDGQKPTLKYVAQTMTKLEKAARDAILRDMDAETKPEGAASQK